MNELDQYIKRILKVKYYTRYMDDFILILKNKDECIDLKHKIENFIHNKLHIELNSKSRYYPFSMGINFCGYRIFTTHRLLRTNSKKKIKNNVKKWNLLYSKNNLDIHYTMQCINSWLGHSSHCNSYKLQQKILSSCNFLYSSFYIENEYNYLISLIENDSKNLIK